MNLQGGSLSYLEEWAGVSLQVSENENDVIATINLENQHGTAWKGPTQILTPESWRKAHVMTEPQNSQEKKYKNSHGRETVWMCLVW